MNEMPSQPKKRRYITLKEVLLVLLVGTLAALAIFTAQDDYSSLSLVSPTVYADELPVVVRFSTTPLLSEQFLDLNGIPTTGEYEQVEGLLRNPKQPPAIEKLSAINTRIGDEVRIFWTYPETVTQVNLYRKEIGGKINSEELLVEATTETSYIDTDVENGKSYEYRAESVIIVDNQTYTARTSPSITVAVSDTVAPGAPTNVTVTPVLAHTETGKAGLQINWKNPLDSDLAYIEVYRSSYFGARGQKMATLTASDETVFFDESALPNVEYYYTVVAYDTVGNGSSSDFQIAAPGNPNPFRPL